MSEFTYEIPDDGVFFEAVMSILAHDTQYKNTGYYQIFRDGYCEISASSTFSQKRWNAMYTSVNFYIPQFVFSSNASILSDAKKTLLKVCQMVMPPNAGYDVMQINISPSLNVRQIDTLNEVLSIANDSKLNILPNEVKQKGKEMAELYVTLYCIENSLRNFIDSTLTDALGDNYFSMISVPSDIAKGITTRKKEESQNKWLPIRGDKQMYYLDFIDLSKIILNNWEYFKAYFPTQSWISTKIDELYKVRCLIAHNSYAGDDEKNMVALYYKQIVKQIGSLS